MALQPSRADQYIYLTYRDTFCGSKARVRDRKVIRNIVLKHWAQSGTPPDEQHLDKTISVLKTLLKDRVFEFERRARKAFPDLFAKSPQSPHAVARSSINGVTSNESKNTDHRRCKDNITSLDPQVSYGAPTVESQLIQFPYEAQHHVLSRVQRLLEETCFCFMERWFPSTLVLNNWTCAAAIELTKSLSIIKNYLHMLPPGCMDIPKQSLFLEIAPDIAQLRHTAVHRLHLQQDKFLQQIDCARTLAGLLQHSDNQNLLQTLHSQVDAQAKKLEYDSKIVKQKADCILSQLSTQREVLAQREQQLRDFVAKRFVELAAVAGRELLEPYKAVPSTGGSKNLQKCDGAHKTIGFGAVVDENDIESDEDRLQAELG
ncbi:hypothetical protein C7974DRAFT_405121 [Boeremia exigua]|uniref:uncharacterized protein n=1 Tax=Boeremia exigua TaxID=749465 RepID=UPI001E8D73E6|nr:uncharacterized protein C7974DRAFT_405121 [Boeremia exigua]KAH6613074.1 hypothetical protein C7974DRAFT_405121 [Boeremia exigua]